VTGFTSSVGLYLISEAGGSSASRGLGTIDPNGPQNNNDCSLILGQVNGGWISPAVLPIPEPATALMMVGGLAALVARRRSR